MTKEKLQPQTNKLFFALKRYADSVGSDIEFISEKENEVRISLAAGQLVFFAYYIASGDEEYSVPGIGIIDKALDNDIVVKFISGALRVPTEKLLQYIDMGHLPAGILGASFPLRKVKSEVK